MKTNNTNANEVSNRSSDVSRILDKRRAEGLHKDVVKWLRRLGRGATTEMPVLTGTEWSPLHGQKTRNGALKGETNTDYVVWTCPTCAELLMGGAGIRLIGSAFDLSDMTVGRCNSLLFEIHCFSCGLHDHFKIPIDQGKAYHELGNL